MALNTCSGRLSRRESEATPYGSPQKSFRARKGSGSGYKDIGEQSSFSVNNVYFRLYPYAIARSIKLQTRAEPSQTVRLPSSSDSHFFLEILIEEVRKTDVGGLTSILSKPPVNQFRQSGI